MSLKKFATFFLATSAIAQTIDLAPRTCGWQNPAEPKALIFATSSVIIGGQATTIAMPVCATIGSNLRVVSTPAGFVLEAVVPQGPPPIIPKMLVEKFPLPDTIPATQERLTITLAKRPATNTAVIVFLQSSRYGSDTVDAAAADNSTRDVVVTLPLHRPFAGDKLMVLYWSLE